MDKFDIVANNSLVAKPSSAVVSLEKTKNLIGLANKLLDKSIAEDESWMQRLWAWADESGIEKADELALFCMGSDSTRYAMSSKNIALANQIKAIHKVGKKNIQLSEREFAIVYLKYWYKYSYEEIGKEVACTDARAEQILSSANAKLSNIVKNKLARNKENLLDCRRINLSEKDITKLPVEFFNLKSLEELYLKLPLMELNQNIEKLNNLRSLTISGADFVNLPESIARLQNLDSLRLWSCQNLEYLPSSIVQLKNLDFIDITSESLSSLPNDIHLMQSLSSIWIWESKLESLPENIFNSKVLRDIQIKGNLTELPESRIWQTLDWDNKDEWRSYNFDFSNNQLKTLPKSFAYLKNSDIDLSNNPLEMTFELKKQIETMEANGCTVTIKKPELKYSSTMN